MKTHFPCVNNLLKHFKVVLETDGAFTIERFNRVLELLDAAPCTAESLSFVCSAVTARRAYIREHPEYQIIVDEEAWLAKVSDRVANLAML
jgi:hypothetical protein